MQTKTLTLLGVLLLGGAEHVSADEPPGAVDPYSSSFYEQALAAGKVYVERRVSTQLYQIDGANAALAGSAGRPIGERLDRGSSLDPTLTESVRTLVEFQAKHNRRLDSWAGVDSEKLAFFEPFKVRDGIVHEIREQLETRRLISPPWPYAAVHWYASADKALRDAEIPARGLDLRPESWRAVGASPEVKRYALFHLLRRARTSGPVDPAFLGEETGSAGFWKQAIGAPANTREFRAKRWRYDIYAYKYLVVDPATVETQAGSLCEFVVEACVVTSSAVSIRDAYPKKLAFYSDLASEMVNATRAAESVRPYLDLYAFVGRTYPCISVFQLGTPRTGAGGDLAQWVQGYPGDRPAEHRFANGSPARLAFEIYQALERVPMAGPSRADAIFGPLLLLPCRSSRGPGGDEIEDIRIGYRGYLDFVDGLK